MPKSTRDSEILVEGYKSYHKALYAVMEFRRQAAKAIDDGLEAHMAELADAIGIDEDVLSNRIAYAAPDRVSSESYDGTEAEVGFRILRGWKQPWQMYFYLWVGDGDECHFIAQVDFKQPDLPIEKLRGAAEDLGTEEYGFEAQEKKAWISEVIPLDGPSELAAIVDVVLDRWIKLWKNVGGLTLLLPAVD